MLPTLDVHLHTSTDVNNLGRYICGLLVERNPKNKQIVPSLAVSWKTLNDTTWEFKLRDDVKFHNGDRLTADDIKFSLERVLDPATKSPRAFLHYLDRQG